LYGVSDGLLLLSALGVDPWDVFHQGLARRTGVAVGTWTILVGAAVIAAVVTGVAIAVEADPQAKFRGERQDLEEMAGNLVDNACKWAVSQVFIEVLVERPVKAGAGPMLRILVDDDGRGLSAAERAQVSRRGQRLDESKPGSGLGLSIVVDLAALYGGSLSLGSAPIGGLRAELVLPGV